MMTEHTVCIVLSISFSYLSGYFILFDFLFVLILLLSLCVYAAAAIPSGINKIL